MKMYIKLCFLSLSLFVIVCLLSFKYEKTEATVKTAPNIYRESIQTKKEVTMRLHKYLQMKGWQISEAKQITEPPFDSSETISFNSTGMIGFNPPNKIYFLVIYFNSEKAAQTKSPIIERFYKSKDGLTVIEENFIIGSLGGNMDNLKTFNQLTEQEIIRLKQQLKEFCNLDKTPFTISKALTHNNSTN